MNLRFFFPGNSYKFQAYFLVAHQFPLVGAHVCVSLPLRRFVNIRYELEQSKDTPPKDTQKKESGLVKAALLPTKCPLVRPFVGVLFRGRVALGSP